MCDRLEPDHRIKICVVEKFLSLKHVLVRALKNSRLISLPKSTLLYVPENHHIRWTRDINRLHNSLNLWCHLLLHSVEQVHWQINATQSTLCKVDVAETFKTMPMQTLHCKVVNQTECSVTSQTTSQHCGKLRVFWKRRIGWLSSLT